MEEKFTFSRRKFVELLGVSAAGFGLVSLAGCGSNDGANEPTKSGSSAAGGAADTITYSLTADPRALDPAYFDDGRVSGSMLQHLRRPSIPVRR